MDLLVFVPVYPALDISTLGNRSIPSALPVHTHQTTAVLAQRRKAIGLRHGKVLELIKQTPQIDVLPPTITTVTVGIRIRKQQNGQEVGKGAELRLGHLAVVVVAACAHVEAVGQSAQVGRGDGQEVGGRVGGQEAGGEGGEFEVGLGGADVGVEEDVVGACPEDEEGGVSS